MKQWPKMGKVPPLGDTETAKEADRLVKQLNATDFKKKTAAEKELILNQAVTAIHRLLWIVGLYRSIRRKLTKQKKCGPRKRLLRSFGIDLEKEKNDGKRKV